LTSLVKEPRPADLLSPTAPHTNRPPTLGQARTQRAQFGEPDNIPNLPGFVNGLDVRRSARPSPPSHPNPGAFRHLPQNRPGPGFQSRTPSVYLCRKGRSVPYGHSRDRNSNAPVGGTQGSAEGQKATPCPSLEDRPRLGPAGRRERLGRGAAPRPPSDRHPQAAPP